MPWFCFFANKEIISKPELTQATWRHSNDKMLRNKFSSRVAVAFFITIFLAVFFFIASIGDVCNHWSLFDNDYWKFSFAMIDVVLISLLIFYSNLELRKIFYKNCSFAFYYFLFVNLIFFYAISILYLLPIYNFLPAYKNTDNNPHACSDFVVPIVGLIIAFYLFVVVVSVSVFVGFFNHPWKRRWFFSLIYIQIIVTLGIFSMVYLLFVSGWTTFLFLILISMSSDTSAFILGRKFGKNRIAQKISPNKTWEGLIYGMFSTLLFILVLIFIYLNVNENHHVLTNIFLNRPRISNPVRGYTYYWWITAGSLVILLIVFNYVGDLVMSFIKRSFRIKDFGNVLKSHGGILDRIDGMSCVFFVFMCIWSIICSLSNADILNPEANSISTTSKL